VFFLASRESIRPYTIGVSVLALTILILFSVVALSAELSLIEIHAKTIVIPLLVSLIVLSSYTIMSTVRSASQN
jgi:hypothetical protein